MPVNKAFNCELPKKVIRNQKNAPFTADELSEVEKRINQLSSRLKATARAVTSDLQKQADEFATVAEARWTNVAAMVEAENLRPGSNKNLINWLEYQLAEKFAVWKNGLGLGSGVTEAGSVRQQLIRTGRKWQGGLDEVMAEIGAAEVVGKASAEVRRILKGKIPKNEMDEIMILAQEVGWHRYAEDAMNIGEAGRQLLKGKQQDFITRLKELNLSENEIERIVNSGKSIADTYHTILEAVRRSGVDVNDASALMGYNPRLFTDEALNRFRWDLEDKGIKFKDGQSLSVEELVVKSRNTNDFVVEDMALLDFLLRRHEPDVYQKLNVTGVQDLIGDRMKVSEALFKYLGEDAVDGLVDTGILSKVPMHSKEVFDYLVKRYELPFKGLNELMVTDPTRAMKHYKLQLERLTSDAGKTWLMLRNAFEEKWGVNRLTVEANPAQYKGFVSLAEIIPDKMKVQFGLSDDALTGIQGGQADKLFRTLEDTYVHPVAAGMYRAVLDISSDANAMGIVGRIFNDINKTFRSMVLTTSGTVFRIVWGNMFQTIAAGGSLLDYANSTRQFLEMAARTTFNPSRSATQAVFDNKRKLFKGLNGEKVTELELYRQAVASGYLQDLSSLTGDAVVQGRKGEGYFTKAGGYIGDSATKYGLLSGRTVEEIGNWISYVGSDVAGQPFRLANNLLDNAAKFSLLKTLTGEGTIKIGQFATSLNTKSFPNLGAAMEHVSDYFFWYDDLGRLDKTIGRYVAPFWTYMSRNPVAQVRSAMRNPSRFMAYHRLYAAMNAPATGEGEDLPRGGLADYQYDQRNIYWVIPEELSATGEREYFAINMSGVDPIGDGQDFAAELGSGVLSLFGLKPQREQGVAARVAENSPWEKTETNNFLRKYLTGDMGNPVTAYPIIQAIAKTIIGEDNFGNSLSGDDPTGTATPKSFLGYEASPLARMWFETLLPPLGLLDRTNPGNIFGAPEIKDEFGYIRNEGQASQMPALPGLNPGEVGSRRSSRDVSKVMAEEVSPQDTAPFTLPSLMNAGVNVTYIDVAKQMGYSESDIRQAINEGTSAVKKIRNARRLESDPTKQVELQAREQQFIQAVLQMRIEAAEVRKWREERGIPDYRTQQRNTLESRAALTAAERSEVEQQLNKELEE